MEKAYIKFLKTPFDYLFSILILVFIMPLILLIIVLIKLSSSGPIFFNQKRLGKNGRVFLLYKFRTMTHKPRSNKSEVFLDNPEITTIGRFLRRFKLDELPQIFNVLIGDMSIVGPRPCLPSLQSEFNADGKKRIKVKPGLTGLAQINGNIYLSWPQRWELDAKYVENISFLLDLKILINSVGVVLLGENRFLRK